jgi:hypothetical protein
MTPQRKPEPVRELVAPKCACGADGCFGLGWPISPVQLWFCPAHKPADYYERRAS